MDRKLTGEEPADRLGPGRLLAVEELLPPGHAASSQHDQIDSFLLDRMRDLDKRFPQ